MSLVGAAQPIARSTASTAAQTAVGNAAGQILAGNAGRKGLIIQNTGTTNIYLLLGTGTPTSSVYHLALKGCVIADDGTGGIYNDDAWVGAVQAIGSALGGALVITEIS
jgi:hypothetical protein